MLAALRRSASAHPAGLAALGFVAILAIAAIVGPSVVPYDPLATNVSRALEGPSFDHWGGHRPTRPRHF